MLTLGTVFFGKHLTWWEYWWRLPGCILSCIFSSTFSTFFSLLSVNFFVFASISLLCNMSSVSFFGVVTSVGKGQGQTAPPQIPPPKPREPRGQGVNSTRAGPGGPLLEKKRGPSYAVDPRGGWGCENYSLYYLMLPNQPRLLSSAFMSLLNDGYASSHHGDW